MTEIEWYPHGLPGRVGRFWIGSGMGTRFDFQRHVTGRLLGFGILGVSVLLMATLMPVLLQSARAEQEHDPEIQASLAAMNLYRSWLGLEPMRIDPALQAAAEAHVEYYRQNVGDPALSGMGLHVEEPGHPGFSGESMQDRAQAQGYGGWVNENAGLSGSMLRSLDWFMGTINHRLPILDPRYTDVGLAAISDGDVNFEIIDFGMPEWSEFSEPDWTVWPPDGVTGVSRSFYGESPSPFPGTTFPTSSPLTVSFHGPGSMLLDRYSIRSDGVEIESAGSVGTGFLSSNTAQIVAVEPFEAGKTYQASVAVRIDGEPYSFEWQFTTRSTDTEPISLDGVASPAPADISVPPVEASPTTSPPPNPTPVPTSQPTANPTATPTEPAPAPTQEFKAPVSTAPPAPPVVADPDPRYPAGLQSSDAAVQQLWDDIDGPVYREEVERSWLWGPDVWASGAEPYLESPDGERRVYYFDKARIEINASENLTSGLLVRDMIQGSTQTGDDTFVDVGPARIGLAGDPINVNPSVPTYASLTNVASVNGDLRSAPQSVETPITETLAATGKVASNPELTGLARYGSYDTTLGHNIASVFVGYFKTLPVRWQDMVGLPLTEPYWIRTRVDGVETWVLVQAFERRVLTYTPTNDPIWQIEMGNVGRHYYEWRYQASPPDGS